MVKSVDEVFRDFETDGVPASGPHEPIKADIRELLTSFEAFVDQGGNSVIFTTRANLFANLAYDANTLAWVVQDSTVAYNGIYQKQGASGTGSWTRVADLPYSLIRASDVGAGTANDIQATSSVPITSSSLVLLNIFETNSASPVTVAFNGENPLTIKTNSGNDVSSGGLISGMFVLGFVSSTNFRIVNDQVSSAIVAAAEAAQIAAEEARDEIISLSQSLTPIFTTLAEAQTYSPSVAPQFIKIAGYFSVGKGASTYKNVGSSVPSHSSKFSITLQDTTVVWFELFEEFPDLYMFGARIDALTAGTDDSLAFNAALDYCYSSTPPKKLKIPSGYIKITGGVIDDIYNSIHIEGCGQRNSVFLVYGSSGIFIRGTSQRAADVKLSNLSINGANMTDGYALSVDYTQATILENVSIYDPFNGLFLRQTGNCVFNNLVIDGNIRGSFGLKAYGENIARNGENDQIDVIQFNNCLFQSNYDGTSTVPTAELFVLDGRVHSVQINGVRCLSALRGFVARNTPAVASNFAPRFIVGSGLETENTYAEGILLIQVDDFRVSDIFCARSFSADGVVVGAACGNVCFDKGYSGSNWNHGVNNQGAAFLTLIDFNTHNNSLSAGNTKSGLFIGGGGRCYVRGGTYGKATWLPAYTEPQKYGIEPDVAFNGELKIDGANLTGNATGPIYDGSAQLSQTGSYVRGCSGYNPGTVGAKTVPASGGAMSSGFRDEMCTVYGGTGVVITSGVTPVINQSPGAFMLPARTSVTVTYSTAPTIIATRM